MGSNKRLTKSRRQGVIWDQHPDAALIEMIGCYVEAPVYPPHTYGVIRDLMEARGIIMTDVQFLRCVETRENALKSKRLMRQLAHRAMRS